MIPCAVGVRPPRESVATEGAPRRGALRAPWVLAIGLALGISPLWGQKTDVITLYNGDRITGEIKGLSRGMLDYSTDDVGRLSIKWEKIARVTSQYYFEVETSSGDKYFGYLAPPRRDGLVVVQLTRPDTLRLTDVVQMVRIDARFISRLKAYLDVGFSLAKANQATTLNTSGEVAYRGPVIGATFAYGSYWQGQKDVATTTRNSANLTLTRFLPRRWGAGAILGAEQNDELALALRLTAGAVAGRTIRQTNASDIGAAAGLVLTRERYARVDSAQGVTDTLGVSLEGVVAIEWSAFRFDSPKLDLASQLRVYPGITTLGRVRAGVEVRVRYEVLKDFFVGLNFTDQFDSRPPGGSGTSNDFVTSISVGWSYRR